MDEKYSSSRPSVSQGRHNESCQNLTHQKFHHDDNTLKSRLFDLREIGNNHIRDGNIYEGLTCYTSSKTFLICFADIFKCLIFCRRSIIRMVMILKPHLQRASRSLIRWL